MMGDSGISWNISKSFAPHSREIKMPAPHHSFLQARCPSCHPTNSVKAEGLNKGSHMHIMCQSLHRTFSHKTHIYYTQLLKLRSIKHSQQKCVRVNEETDNNCVKLPEILTEITVGNVSTCSSQLVSILWHQLHTFPDL